MPTRNSCLFQLQLLRINDFLALIVPEREDYMSSNQDSQPPSTVTITSPLYIGGAPASIVGPFDQISEISVRIYSI